METKSESTRGTRVNRLQIAIEHKKLSNGLHVVVAQHLAASGQARLRDGIVREFHRVLLLNGDRIIPA